jgi:hypothetical protein
VIASPPAAPGPARPRAICARDLITLLRRRQRLRSAMRRAQIDIGSHTSRLLAGVAPEAALA